MTNSDFPEQARVDASTSLLFPTGSHVHFDRIQPSEREARIVLKREGEAPEELFQAKLPQVALPGQALFIEGPVEGVNGEELLLVITICTGETPGSSKKFLVGQVLPRQKGRDPGGTGVWVSEEPPPVGETIR